MDTNTKTRFGTVDQYIAAQEADTRVLLTEMRAAIMKAAPQAEEVISYNIPAVKWQGMLVWYAAFKNHIGLYPRGSGIEAFAKELSKYESAKGSVQFPKDRPLPLALVTRIVKFRMRENAEKATLKGAAASGNAAAKKKPGKKPAAKK